MVPTNLLQQSPIWGLMDDDMRMDCVDYFRKACRAVRIGEKGPKRPNQAITKKVAK